MAQEEVLLANAEDKVTEVTGNGKENAVRDKAKERRDRNRPPSKIVVRRLPPTMTEAVFREQVSPIPDHDYMCFVRADLSLGPGAFSRAYINFIHHSDILTFKDQFDGYIFVDMLGNEYAAVVEFAPFQRLPKKNLTRRKDAIAGTIEEDPAYVVFLQTLEEELKDKENEHTFDYAYQLPDKDDKKVTTTPLLEFLKQRRAERQRSRDERKEERRKKERDREAERRKARDDERRKKRPEKEGVAAKQLLHNPAKEQDPSVRSPRVKDVKPAGDRKRDEEKPAYKDAKKYPEGRVGIGREKPGFKTSTSSRPKSSDTRQTRDDRRSSEDLRKKSEASSSRRATSNAKQSKYNEKESRGKDKDQRKNPRSNKEDVKRSGDTKANDETNEGDKLVETSAIHDHLSSSSSKQRVMEGARRFSLEGAQSLLDLVIKPFRKSAESLHDTMKPTGQLSEELMRPPKSGYSKSEKLRRCSLESGGMEGDNVKSASGNVRGTMRRNLSLELDTERSRDEGGAEKSERKRPERRIRNKDRPSIEIYRPGMGRIAKQRSDKEKD